jgi:5'-3' exonuclease
MRQPLIDSDVLLYEIGYASEAAWRGEGVPSWECAEELLLARIDKIYREAEADTPPIFFLTGKGNFRYDIATRTPYKERPGLKPYHYKNIKAYIRGMYDYREQDGLEADDLLAIEQTRRPGEVIVCTRDKDCRAVPGWHYGWELANQPQFGPMLVDEVGRIWLEDGKPRKLRGYGLLFFYAQCLMGDDVDSIPGLGNKTGPVKAFKILDGCVGIDDAYKRVLEAYRGLYGDRAEIELLEQGRLLHMTRSLHPDGSPVLWELPN